MIGALVGLDVVVPYLGVVGVLYQLSWLVSLLYLARHRVLTQPPRYGPKFVVSAVLVYLPFVVLLGVWVDLSTDGIFVFVVASVCAEVGSRRWWHGAADAEEEELDRVAQHQVPARRHRYRWWIPVAAVPVLGLLGFAIGYSFAAVGADPFWLGVLAVGALVVATVVQQRRRRRTADAPATEEEPGL